MCSGREGREDPCAQGVRERGDQKPPNKTLHGGGGFCLGVDTKQGPTSSEPVYTASQWQDEDLRDVLRPRKEAEAPSPAGVCGDAPVSQREVRVSPLRVSPAGSPARAVGNLTAGWLRAQGPAGAVHHRSVPVCDFPVHRINPRNNQGTLSCSLCNVHMCDCVHRRVWPHGPCVHTCVFCVCARVCPRLCLIRHRSRVQSSYLFPDHFIPA